MPELPEVENVRLSLIDKLIGQTVVQCKVATSKIIKKPDIDTNFVFNIMGCQFKDLKRSGKYLLGQMENGKTLVVHLGMTGLLINVIDINQIPVKYAKHIHVTMQLSNNTLLCYCDIRKFGGLRLLDATQLSKFLPLSNLGPEPFDDNAYDRIKAKLSQKKYQNKTIKEVLMDQTVVSGIGNIYANEILYKVQILPTRLVSAISDLELQWIIKFAESILKLSIIMGGSSISDYLNGNGQSGNFQKFLVAYGKDKCLYGHDIKQVVIKGRNTFYCPICQK